MENNSIDFFKNINFNPKEITVTSALCRMVDGVGFRYYWATYNLQEQSYDFKPGIDRWTIGDTISHIWDTANWINRSLNHKRTEKPETSVQLRDSTLQIIYLIRSFFNSITDSDLPDIQINKAPFWNIINGPLEDIVSHVGAIDNLRRTAGDFPEEPHFFDGTQPD